MKELSSHNMTIDVIVTSPPYNLNKAYGSYNDNKERTKYLDWLRDVAELSYSVLKDDGSFFLNIGGTPSGSMLPFEVVGKFKEANYRLQNTIHWIKSISFEKADVGKMNTIRDYSTGHWLMTINNSLNLSSLVIKLLFIIPLEMKKYILILENRRACR